MFMQFNAWEYLYYQHNDRSIPKELWVGADAFHKGLVETQPGSCASGRTSRPRSTSRFAPMSRRNSHGGRSPANREHPRPPAELSRSFAADVVPVAIEAVVIWADDVNGCLAHRADVRAIEVTHDRQARAI